MFDGLAFIAPEDLVLDLIERARGETSLAEATAILLAQRDALAWDVLMDQAQRRGLIRHLGALLEAISIESETDVIPQGIIEEFYRRAIKERSSPGESVYPPGRCRSVPPIYRPIVDRWGIRLVLPRYVIIKVLFDLRLQPKWS
jgi:hypothetical protein